MILLLLYRYITVNFERPPALSHKALNWQNFVPPLFIHVILRKLAFSIYYSLRQTAILKINPVYLKFLSNSSRP
jgi:hypothetical protein